MSEEQNMFGKYVRDHRPVLVSGVTAAIIQTIF